MIMNGRGSLNVPKIEQVNRTGVYIPAKCGSKGRMLIKTCEEDGHTGDEQKMYEPLDLIGIPGGLQYNVDGSGNFVLKTLGALNSGTLIIDDGANWRITLEFNGGVLVNEPTIAASIAALAQWTAIP